MKRIGCFLLALVIAAGMLPTLATDTAAAEPKLTWPVPGHVQMSRGTTAKHTAVDIHDKNIEGAVIVAAYSGIVTHVYLCGKNHYAENVNGVPASSLPCKCDYVGTGVVIRGYDGRQYQYAHMIYGSIFNDITHNVHVEAGQPLGRVGNTGASSGPHLHFGISGGPEWYENLIDPWPELKEGRSMPLVGLAPPAMGSDFADHYKIEDTNAMLMCQATIAEAPGTYTALNASAVGMYLYDAQGNMLASVSEKPGAGFNNSQCSIMYYNINKELGYTLTPGTTYLYKFFLIRNGVTHYSDMHIFTTTGNSPMEYTISFDANGGSTAPAAVTAASGVPVTIPMQIPTWDGYIFMGWSASTLGPVQYQPGTSFTGNGNMTLYAVWEAEPVTVSFETPTSGDLLNKLWHTETNAGLVCQVSVSRGTLSASSVGMYLYDAQGNELGSTSEVPVAAFNNAQTSSMWYNVTADLGCTLTPGTTYLYKFFLVRDGITYYSDLISFQTKGDAPIPQYTVSFDPNGGTGGPGPITVAENAEFTIPADVPIRDGYTFLGWAVTPSGMAEFSPGEICVTTGSVTLYAVWQKNNTITVTKVVPDKTEYTLGERISFRVQFSGEGEISSMEYQVYNASGQYICGSTGISDTYSFVPATADTYMLRLIMTAGDGHVQTIDSVAVTVKAPQSETKVSRISGTDRHATAFQIADMLKSQLGIEKFSTIIIASGSDSADALAGSYLAARMSAPILLSRGSSHQRNLEYIQANLAEGGIVYILGGTAAVPQEMEDLLAANNISYERLKGKTRFDTNLAILDRAGIQGDEILVSTGYNFADSLSASASGKPILLVHTNANVLTNSQKIWLETQRGKTFTIIGGTGAVSETLEAALAEYGTVTRLKGSGREATSVEVAKKFFTSPDTALLAYSRNFPDGLCGGPLAYNLGAPLLLVNAGKEADANGYVNQNSIRQGYILGGTGVISDDTARTVFGLDSSYEIPKQ